MNNYPHKETVAGLAAKVEGSSFVETTRQAVPILRAATGSVDEANGRIADDCLLNKRVAGASSATIAEVETSQSGEGEVCPAELGHQPTQLIPNANAGSLMAVRGCSLNDDRTHKDVVQDPNGHKPLMRNRPSGNANTAAHNFTDRRSGEAQHGAAGERQPGLETAFMQYCAGVPAFPMLERRSVSSAPSSQRSPISPASAWAEHRASLVREWRALQTSEDGQPPMADSATMAAKMLGTSHASLIRWSRLYDAGGVDALIPGYDRCGRKPLASMTEDECRAVQYLVLRTDTNIGHKISVAYALRQFALMDGVELLDGSYISCSDSLREAILKPRRKKRTITMHLKRQARVTPEMKMLYRGPKTFQLNAFTQPRDLTWIDEYGVRKDILPGDFFEWDDMTFNTGFFVPWDDPADPCARRWGVRPFRAQLLACLDVGSGRFIAFGIVARYGDAYRAKDIRWNFNNCFRTVGLPRVGQRLEHGAWAADIITALNSVVKIFPAKDAKGKIIEGRFNAFQKAMALRGVNLGRKRGEFEKENKDWSRTRAGVVHPKEVGYVNLADVSEWTASAMTAVNVEPMEGDIYKGVPDEHWINTMSTHPLRKPTMEEAWQLLPQQGITTIRGGMASATVEEINHHVHFCDPQTFARLGAGYKLHYAFDHADLEAGCIIRNREIGARSKFRPADPSLQSGSAPRPYVDGEFICRAQYVDRVPQFQLVASRHEESLERRRKFTQQCRLMFREVMPFGVGRAAKVDERRDGRGGVQRIEISNGSKPNNTTVSRFDESAANARDTDIEPATFSTRGTVPTESTDASSHPRPGSTTDAVPRATVPHRKSRWELLETETP